MRTCLDRIEREIRRNIPSWVSKKTTHRVFCNTVKFLAQCGYLDLKRIEDDEGIYYVDGEFIRK